MGTHSPRGHKELDTTEQLTHTHTYTENFRKGKHDKTNSLCGLRNEDTGPNHKKSGNPGRKASWNSRSEKILFFGPHFWGYLFFKKKKMERKSTR